MSLVGTRPPTLDEWEKYEPHHRARMSFRPGLTGLWQVSGRSNITDFEKVVKLDTQYIGEWSVKNDLKIIFQTIVGRNACQVILKEDFPYFTINILMCIVCAGLIILTRPLKSTPPIIGDVASCIRPEDYLTMA